MTRQWHVRLCRLFTAGCAESVRGAPGHLGFGVSALALGFRSSRVPSRPTSRSSRRRVLASLKLAVGRVILAHNRRRRRGLTLALGGEKHSFVVLFTLQYCRFLLQCSSACLSARCSSVAVLCALRLGLRDGAMACAGVWAAHFRLHGKGSGRARCVRLRFSAAASCVVVLGFPRA